jgi:hypothetical protein
MKFYGGARQEPIPEQDPEDLETHLEINQLQTVITDKLNMLNDNINSFETQAHEYGRRQAYNLFDPTVQALNQEILDAIQQASTLVGSISNNEDVRYHRLIDIDHNNSDYDPRMRTFRNNYHDLIEHARKQLNELMSRFTINEGGSRHKTRSHKTRRHKTRRHKTRRHKTRRHKKKY